MAIEIIIVAFLIILGIALLMAEIFLLPGITIAGIAGGISILGGIVYAFTSMGNTAGFITIGVSAVAGCGTFVYLIKSNAINKIALKTDIESKVDQSELQKVKIGDIGKAISRLNPIGKADFNDTIVEAKSFTGEFIDEGAEIEIVKVDSSNVLVQEVNKI
ncbi:MAG: NfeD family protein [Dysgonomonas sp.]